VEGELELSVGDINGDGKINSIDANALARIISGTYSAPENDSWKLTADINGDGDINSIDANLFKRILAGA